MDRFKQISTFAAVATRGSLSAAARAEGISPAVVSRRLDALEERLGVKLVARTTRRVTLTFEGSAFLEDCQRILREMHDAETSVMLGGVKASGHLRITAPAGFGRQHVAPLVPSFVAEHPEVSITLLLSDRITDIVNEGIDLAIRIGTLEDSNLVAVKLADNSRAVVASPAYLERHGTPMHPDELAEHRCLMLGPEANQSRGWQFIVDGEPCAVRGNGPFECNDGAVLHDWALAGEGLAWRSLWEIGDDLREGRLVTVLDAFATPGTAIHAVFAERRRLPLRVRMFIDMLKNTYANPDYWQRA
ncbi:MAG: LysR family transcriptional regulator [Burkholderiaceae bacterium]